MQGVGGPAEDEFGGGVEGESGAWRVVVSCCSWLAERSIGRELRDLPEEQVLDIDHLPFTTHQADEVLTMPLEAFQITNTVLDELRPDQLPRVVPDLPIRREDAVTQKLVPIPVEGLALAEVRELSSQDCLDVLGIRGEDHALAAWGGFDRVWVVWVAVNGEVSVPEFEVVVVYGVHDPVVDHAKSYP